MKTRLFIVTIVIAVIILGSATYVYSQMYDCLNPPPWMKIPYFGFEKCFQLFMNGNLMQVYLLVHRAKLENNSNNRYHSCYSRGMGNSQNQMGLESLRFALFLQLE